MADDFANGFVQLPPRAGGQRANNVPPPPPPPPGHGGGSRPVNMPQRSNANVVNAVHPQQGQQQRMMQQAMAPPPPLQHNMMPPRQQQGPFAEISDITREQLSDAEVREELSDYYLIRIVKAGGEDDDGCDSTGEKANSPWARCRRIPMRDLSKKQNQRQIQYLNRTTKPVEEKKKEFSPTQQRQIERALEELAAMDRDRRYHFVLAQLEHQTKLKEGDRKKKKGAKTLMKSTKGSLWKPSQDRRKSNDRNKSRERSKDGQKTQKHKRIRVAIYAYYKRCPRPEEDARRMLQERDMVMLQRSTLPPMQNHASAGQQQYAPAGTQPAQGQAQQGQGFNGRRPPPGGAVPPRLPAGVTVAAPHNGQKGEKKKEKKYRHHSRSPRSSRSSQSSYSDTDDSGSDDGTLLTSPSDLSSGRHSRNRGRRKSSRYLESPGAYGVESGFSQRRPSRYNHHLLTDEIMPRAPLPPMLALPSPIRVEQAKQDAYAAGRADERAAAEEAMAIAAASAYTPRTAPRPLVIQRGPSVRHIHPRDVGRSFEEDDELDRRIRRMRLEDELLDDLAFEEDIRRDERRRIAEHEERLRWQEEEETRFQEAEFLRREEERRRAHPDHMRRRDASPIGFAAGNPFAPRERRGSFRRVSTPSPRSSFPEVVRHRV